MCLNCSRSSSHERLTQENLAAFNKVHSKKPIPSKSGNIEWDHLLQPGLGQPQAADISQETTAKAQPVQLKELQPSLDSVQGQALTKHGEHKTIWTSPRASSRRQSERFSMGTSQGQTTTDTCRASSIQLSNFTDMDNTEYLLPAGMSPFVQPKSQLPRRVVHKGEALKGSSTSTETTPSGPTVKELLTPLADRMNKIQALSSEKQGLQTVQKQKMHAARSLNFNNDDNPNDDPIEIPNVVDLSFGSHLDDQGEDADKDDTYTEGRVCQREKQQMEDSSAHVKSAEQSRYSVTDYFKKYSGGASGRLGNVQLRDELEYQSIESISGGESLQSSGEDLEKARQVQEHDERIFFKRSNVERHGSNGGDSSDEHFGENVDDVHIDDVESEGIKETYEEQEGLYKGTELDTSLSTIEDHGTVTSMTSIGSVNSVDDRAFRQGLADLDANIAKMQQALRDSIH